MPATRPRPDLEAHQHAMRVPFRDVAGELRELLGARLAAYLGGVSETHAVRQWADVAGVPSNTMHAVDSTECC